MGAHSTVSVGRTKATKLFVNVNEFSPKDDKQLEKWMDDVLYDRLHNCFIVDDEEENYDVSYHIWDSIEELKKHHQIEKNAEAIEKDLYRIIKDVKKKSKDQNNPNKSEYREVLQKLRQAKNLLEDIGDE